MFRVMDKVYFWFKDHIKGYDEGYSDGYRDGDCDGRFAQYIDDIATLKEHEPVDFKDDSYRLGYHQAIEILRKYAK